MKPLGTHNYFVYITTNYLKKVLYTGVTNDLKIRLQAHYQDANNFKKHFAGRYNCFNLVFFERFQYIQHAIDREKEIKGWSRIKKEKLISEFNPDWNFLNNEID